MESVRSRRYGTVGLLGSGGMGTAWRAVDRLTGHEICLKRPRVTLSRLGSTSEGIDAASSADELASAPTMAPNVSAGTADTLDSGAVSGRLALAREFRVLASLRHPAIISVLDYGFDLDMEPYVTMELLEDGQTVVEAAAGCTTVERGSLLLQMFEGIEYLHRHRVLHRDLKPSNVIVSGNRVKVLDFGIATGSDDERRAQVAGTMGYIAPEVMLGRVATERSDIYSAGVLASEVLLGHKPDALDDSSDAALLALIGRLTAANPADRPESARVAGRAIAEAVGLTLPGETREERESYLSTPTFVGRTEELSELMLAWHSARFAKGSCVVVVGESGVGKSRLVRELRTRALVEGALVLRGQARASGSRPYEVWRDVLRNLLVEGRPSIEQAGALQHIITDVADLLELNEPLAPPPAQTAEGVRTALIEVLGELLSGATRPVLMLLEDVHWGRPESLEVLAVLARHVGHRRLMVVATARGDELNDAGALSHVPVMDLSRLGDEALKILARSVVGDQAESTELLARLVDETRGNPFFAVESLGAWAEAAGRLERVSEADFGAELLPSGVETLLTRRLDRLGAEARTQLQLAAVYGREIDQSLLDTLDPDYDWNAALSSASDAGILAADSDAWRFAHDKLRERLVGETAERHVQIHARLAVALEQLYGHVDDRAGTLAFHYGEAGDLDNEARSARRAGEHALSVGAPEQAAAHLSRAVELLSPSEVPTTGAPRPFRWMAELFARDVMTTDPHRLSMAGLQGHLFEAYFQSGKLTECIPHARAALAWLGHPMPVATPSTSMGIMGQMVLRRAQSWLSGVYRTEAGEKHATRLLASSIQMRLTEAYAYTNDVANLFYSGFRALNLGAPAGPSPALAQAYVTMGIVVSVVPMADLTRRLCQHAVDMAAALNRPFELSYCHIRRAACGVQVADWERADESLEVALELADRLRNARLRVEGHTVRAFYLLARGQYDAAAAGFAKVGAMAEDSRDGQAKLWALTGSGFALLRSGDLGGAGHLHARAGACVDDSTPSSDLIYFRGLSAALYNAEGDMERLREAAELALVAMAEQAPVTYWSKFGLDGACDAWLTLLEHDPTALKKAAQAVKITAGFGKRLSSHQRAVCFGRHY